MRNYPSLIGDVLAALVVVCLVTFPVLHGQEIIYDLESIGGNVFPGQDGRLTTDDAQLGGDPEIRRAESVSIPVAAAGSGTADVTAYIYEDSGDGPGELLWQATYLNQPFTAGPAGGSSQTITWDMINTPVPDNVYWGVRFRNVSDSITAIGPREGTFNGVGTSDDQILYVQPSGNPNGTFTQFDFFLNNTVDVPDNLAATIEASSLRPVPEPRVIGLLLIGGLAILWLRRRAVSDDR